MPLPQDDLLESQNSRENFLLFTYVSTVKFFIIICLNFSDSIEMQSARLLNISKNAIFFKKIDVELSIQILHRIMPHISNLTTKLTTDNILPILNNMIDTPEDSLVQAEKAKLSVNK